MWRPEDLHVVVLARAVFTLHGRGGLERHVYDLVRHLAYRGVRITLVTRPPTTIDGQASLDDDLPDDRVTMRFVPYRTFPLAGRRGTTVIDRSTAYPLFGWRAGRLAARLVRAGGVQVVHGLGASALGYASARRGTPLETVPFVFNPQGLEEFGATDPTRARLKRLAYRPLQAAVRACATAADRVIATDRVLVPVVLGALPISPSRLAIVPNAIDVAAIDKLTTAAARSPDELTTAAAPSPDERGGLGHGDRILLSVGRLEENKGFHVLAEALARVGAATGTATRNRWRWVVLGDGPYRRRLERAVRQAGLVDRVTLRGAVSETELHAWYEAATLFVLPTLYEGSSLVTLEAMAHRRAVIATTAGGLPDKVRPGVSGWLVPPGDVGALTRAVGEALGAPGRLSAMGAAGRALVEREFSWTSATDRLLELYQAVLEGPGPAHAEGR